MTIIVTSLRAIRDIFGSDYCALLTYFLLILVYAEYGQSLIICTCTLNVFTRLKFNNTPAKEKLNELIMYNVQKRLTAIYTETQLFHKCQSSVTICCGLEIAFSFFLKYLCLT